MTLIPILLALAAQIAQTPAPVPVTVPTTPPPAPAKALAPLPTAQRYEHCVDLATGDDPKKGEADAAAWQQAGGRYFAQQCLGIALANQGKWPNAATQFEGAADGAEVAHDIRAARFWAQAGNAWLAAGDAVKARSALDAALGAGTLEGLERGEAIFDHARALVVLGALDPARTDMDVALTLAPKDPLVWLSSATLARKMKDFPRAKHDIIEAYGLSPDDAAIRLEIGNIAAASGDADGARMGWTDAARLGGDTPIGDSARAALKQFDEPAKPGAATPK